MRKVKKALFLEVMNILKQIEAGQAVKWGELQDYLYCTVEKPSSEFVERIDIIYSGTVRDLEYGMLSLVLGKYIRRDYYSENKYDTETSYFITLTENEVDGGYYKASVCLTEQEFVSLLLEFGYNIEKYTAIVSRLFKEAEVLSEDIELLSNYHKYPAIPK